MLMASVRDSRNWLIDFEGAPDEKQAIKTGSEELSKWYRDTGFYSTVAFDPDVSVARMKTINKTATNHILLWIKVTLLQQGNTNHVIPLESPIIIDEVNNKVTFDYWTWGQQIKSMATTLTAFKANYLGVTTATF